MKLRHELLLIFIILIGGIIFAIFEDNAFNKKMTKYKDISYEGKLDIIITSAYYIDKWFIINDSLSFNAINLDNDLVWLSNYLKPMDRVVKQSHNDTLYVLRGRRVEKFIIIRG